MTEVRYPRSKGETRQPLTEKSRILLAFLIPGFTGWFVTCWLYLQAVSNQESMTLADGLFSLLVTPLFMLMSVLAAGTLLPCLLACAVFATSLSWPPLRHLKPLTALALGFAISYFLETSFLPSYMAGMEAEGIHPWPFWMIHYPAGIITAFSAWLSATILFRRPWCSGQVLAEGPSVTEAPTQTVTSPAHQEDRIEA